MWLLTPTFPVLVHILFGLFLPQGGLHRWLVPALYGIAFLLLLQKLIRRGPKVILSNKGIEDRRLGIGLIPWEEISQLAIEHIHAAEFLAVSVIDPDKYATRMSWANRLGSRSLVKHGYPPIAISFEMLDTSWEVIWTFIEKYRLDLVPSATSRSQM